MFLNPNPYSASIGKMPKYCPSCGVDFEPEPGFYFGAMMISYALAAPFCLLFFSLLNFGIDITFDVSLVIVMIVQLLIAPYLFHLSRAIYLYFHVHSDPSLTGEPSKKG
ncbi:MAG: hypothetical protein ACI959_000040 [Limisphaerales bacterium]|jgi:hypothetical protein